MLLVPEFLEVLERNELDRAAEINAEMLEIARRTADHDVLAFGLLCSGELSMARGEAAGASKRFDEVMVSVTTDDVSPITAGIVYCAVIEACMAAFDLRRAAEWTDALQDWCTTQPDLVPFRGQCLVHRSQVLQARGRWSEAIEEAALARANG